MCGEEANQWKSDLSWEVEAFVVAEISTRLALQGSSEIHLTQMLRLITLAPDIFREPSTARCSYPDSCPKDKNLAFPLSGTPALPKQLCSVLWAMMDIPAIGTSVRGLNFPSRKGKTIAA